MRINFIIKLSSQFLKLAQQLQNTPDLKSIFKNIENMYGDNNSIHAFFDNLDPKNPKIEDIITVRFFSKMLADNMLGGRRTKEFHEIIRSSEESIEPNVNEDVLNNYLKSQPQKDVAEVADFISPNRKDREDYDSTENSKYSEPYDEDEYEYEDEYDVEYEYNSKESETDAKSRWKPLDWLAAVDRILKIAESRRTDYPALGFTIPGTGSTDLLKAARERYKICLEQFLKMPSPDPLLYNLIGIIYILGQENRSIFGGMLEWQNFHKLSIGMSNGGADWIKFIQSIGLTKEQIDIFNFIKWMASKHKLGESSFAQLAASNRNWQNPSASANLVSNPDQFKPTSGGNFQFTVDPDSVIRTIESSGTKPQSASLLRSELQTMNDVERQTIFHKINNSLSTINSLNDAETKETILRILNSP